MNGQMAMVSNMDELKKMIQKATTPEEREKICMSLGLDPKQFEDLPYEEETVEDTQETPSVPVDSTNINDFDSTIDNGMFYTKVDNIYVMLYTALMFNDLSRVDHKVSDEVMQQYNPQVQDCKSKNQRHMYGQLNVKSTNIDHIHLDEEGNIIVDVTLIGRYLDYIIDLSTGNKISGDDQERIERTYKLVLKKSKDALALTESRHCPSCGQPADLSKTGKCSFCNSIFPLDQYDYILESIEVIG